MKTIPLYNSKRVAIVDDDYECEDYVWRYSKDGARSAQYHEVTFLHRHVMKAQKGQAVRHRNGNKFDCRRENLYLTTWGEIVNSYPRPFTKTPWRPYRGVRLVREGFWTTTISVNRKTKYCGTYTDPEAAARLYDYLNRLYNGERAYQNFKEAT